MKWLEDNLSGVRINEKIQEEGIKVGYSTVKDYICTIKKRDNIFIRCHINAFHYFVGIPQYVKIDNLKSAILHANFYEPIYQELYKNFAFHYGFHPLPCRVRRPNDKGKVESGIKYVKNNFFLGRKFTGCKDVKERLFKWYIRANHRIHGTTRKVPQEVFEKEEKVKLIPLPQEEFKLVKVGSRKVYHDCHIYRLSWFPSVFYWVTIKSMMVYRSR